MLGKGVVRKSAAVRAGQSEGDIFAALFERHLTEVFEAAWRVLNDRGAAAEVTFETFAEAWRRRYEMPVDERGASLVVGARRRAQAWLDAHPEAAHAPSHPADGRTAPSLGPTLRARIINALDAQGVPVPPAMTGFGTTGSTPAVVPIERPPVDRVDPLAPPPLAAPYASSAPSDPEGLPISGSSPTVPGPGAPLAPDSGGFLAGTRARLIAAVGAVVVLLVMGLVLNGKSDATATDGGQVETASTLRSDLPGRPTATTAAKRGSTTTAASSSTTTSSSTTSTTASSTTTTTEPEDVTTTVPSGGGGPVGPPPTHGTTTTTRAPEPPRIHDFSGDFYDFNGDRCRSPDELLSIRWSTENATSARIRRDGGNWYPVDQLPNGGFELCARFGTRWYLEVSNEAGTDTESFVRNEMTHT